MPNRMVPHCIAATRGPRVIAAVCAVSALLATTVPAQAQVFFRWWNEPIYVERYAPELMTRGEVRAMLRSRGFALRGPIRRNGHVYIADVRTRRGASVRLIIDAVEGRIVERFVDSTPPRPPRNLENRYSRRTDPDNRGFDEPSVDRSRLPYFERPETAGREKSRPAKPKTEKQSARPATRKARRTKDIVKRDLPPPKTADPAPLAPRVVYPAAKPAATPPSVAARPQPQRLPVEEPAARRQITLPQPVAPKIEKHAPAPNPPTTTAARPAESDVAPRKPKMRFLKPERAAAKPAAAAQTPGNSSLLPPPALPAEVKVPVELKTKRNAKPRLGVAPLDDPGQRRDIPKPVAVAPLQ